MLQLGQNISYFAATYGSPTKCQDENSNGICDQDEDITDDYDESDEFKAIVIEAGDDDSQENDGQNTKDITFDDDYDYSDEAKAER